MISFTIVVMSIDEDISDSPVLLSCPSVLSHLGYLSHPEIKQLNKTITINNYNNAITIKQLQ